MVVRAHMSLAVVDKVFGVLHPTAVSGAGQITSLNYYSTLAKTSSDLL
jgi:hypothetical protein